MGDQCWCLTVIFHFPFWKTLRITLSRIIRLIIASNFWAKVTCITSATFAYSIKLPRALFFSANANGNTADSRCSISLSPRVRTVSWFWRIEQCSPCYDEASHLVKLLFVLTWKADKVLWLTEWYGPKTVNILIPSTLKCIITLHGKKDFADVIMLRFMRQRDYLGSSNITTRSLQEEERKLIGDTRRDIKERCP